MPISAHCTEAICFPKPRRAWPRFRQENPGKTLLRLGIGDVTLPVADAVVRALCAAAEEMGRPTACMDMRRRPAIPLPLRRFETGIMRQWAWTWPRRIFSSPTARSRTPRRAGAAFAGAVVAVCDPVYPVYADSNAMAGRRVVYLPCRAKDGFAPPLPRERVDAVYLMHPNNPTGMALSRDALAGLGGLRPARGRAAAL